MTFILNVMEILKYVSKTECSIQRKTLLFSAAARAFELLYLMVASVLLAKLFFFVVLQMFCFLQNEEPFKSYSKATKAPFMGSIYTRFL